MNFASDNNSGVSPDILAAIASANDGSASAYGSDDFTQQAVKAIQKTFEAPDAAVYFVPTGTAANALALSCICPPWGTVFCHDNAHIEEDECGAPEFYMSGAKLSLVGGDDAKINPEKLEQAISYTGRAGVHNIQRGAVSISQTTEHGGVYSINEIKTLSDITKSFQLPFHMDGARYSNALVAKKATAAEMSWKSGVDVLSFGGTKNGLLGVEAVIFFDPKHAWEFELRRKRGGHLLSKHRYLAAQILAYFKENRWLKNAQTANDMAAYFASKVRILPNAELNHPTEANAIFACFPRAMHILMQDAGVNYYMWPFDQTLKGDPSELLSARFVCSWNTSKTEIDQLFSLLNG